MERCQGSRPVHRGLQRRPPSSAVHRGRLLALMSWVPLWALALCGVPWAPLAVRGAPLPSGAPFFTLRQWVRYAGVWTVAYPVAYLRHNRLLGGSCLALAS